MPCLKKPASDQYCIYQIEQEFYHALTDWRKTSPTALLWLQQLPDWQAAINDKNRYAHAPYYASLVENLPSVAPIHTELNADCVGSTLPLSLSEFKKTKALIRQLMPWRKGGFLFWRHCATDCDDGDGGDGNQDGNKQLHIDTEWRSDLKWQRIAPHINLRDKCVLDVGGGSGYHGFRMAGAGAASVVVIDPSALFYHQFLTIKKLTRTNNVHFAPVPLDALPVPKLPEFALFDVVFCMGVLYHRPSPFDCLWQLKAQLKKGGTLVLETLVIDGDERAVLVPTDRYAKMNNVYFLPSVAALCLWLKKAGFGNIRVIDASLTTSEEQRKTDFMTYESLSDFLTVDGSQTVEGYPPPKRAVVLASI